MNTDISIATPPDLERRLSKLSCPVCKGELQVDDATAILEWKGKYYTTSVQCIDLDDHYTIEVEYEDPKKILLTTQTIVIIEENTCYTIEYWQGVGKQDHGTQITVEDFDTHTKLEVSYAGERILDFKHYNKKRWVSELKTLLLLG